MKEHFNVTPFSFLDTRKKDWLDRKREWITTFDIQSEKGRELITNNGTFDLDNGIGSKVISVFDPVLCELMYKWFTPPSGSIIDPFAGGSVRGIVAEELGFKYTGIELREEQVTSNIAQSSKPRWIIGDSEEELNNLEEKFNFAFSCPPYYDLEVYSTDGNDLSQLNDDNFNIKYKNIVSKLYNVLEDDSFACFVISEVRNSSFKGRYTEGFYKGLVSKTKEVFEEAGFNFYNDVVLLNSTGTAAKVVDLYFNKNRKLASVHQNVLIFVKGNPDLATIKIQGDDDYKPCIIDDVTYSSPRQAALRLNLETNEVKRRLDSKLLNHHNYLYVGIPKTLVVKYKVNSYYFESTIQIENLTGVNREEIRNRFESNNPMWKDYVRLDKPIEIEDMETYFHSVGGFSLPLPKTVLVCKGKEYYTIKEAAKGLDLSRERVRQKLLSQKYNDFYYL